MYKFVKNGTAFLLQLFKKYKSVLRFILMFMGSYFIFSIFYNAYLEFSEDARFYPDFFTHLVAVQSQELIGSFGYKADILPHPEEPSMRLFIDGNLLARIVEGCNSLSIMILFSSFVLAFFAKARITLPFILAGAVVIYSMNLLRIAVLAIGVYKFPQHTEFLHTIIFPLIIYGTVFLLWIFWVRIFAKHGTDENTL